MRTIALRLTGITVLAFTSIVAACGGKDSTPPPPTPEIALSLSSNALSVAQGASGTVTATVGRTNFTSAVNLTVEGLPTGVTGTFNPASVPNGTTTSTLTITAGASAAPGTSTLTIRAAGSGVTDKTATVALTVTVAGNYTLSASPATVNVVQGASGSSTVNITRTGGFAGSVALAVTGAPTGLTATLNPTSTTGNSSALSISAASTTALGTYTLTITGTATGLANQTTTVSVTVAAPASYSLSASPATLSIAQGSSASSTVNITRTGGFSGSVSLAASGAPAGLTASFNPTSTTGNSSTLTLTAGSSTAAGTYTLTITGTATGLANQTTTLTVTVTAVTSTSLSFCAADAPIWFAYQNEGSAWTRLAPGANNTYSFTSTPKVGIATVTQGTGQNSTSYDLTVVYATTAELQALSSPICSSVPGTKTLNGTVANVGAQEFGLVFMDSTQAFANPSTGAYSLTALPEGPLDLVGVRVTSPNLTDFTPNKLIIRRSVNLPSNSTIPVLDFGAGEAFNPTSAGLTLSGVGSDEANVDAFLLTGGGTFALLSFASQVPASSTIYGVPSAQLGANDIHAVFASAAPANNSTDFREVIKYMRNVAATTIDFGPALNNPTVTVITTTPYGRLRTQLVSQAEYGSASFASYSQTDRSTTVAATANYFGGTPTTWDLSVPDLSGVSGFDVNWGLKAGTATETDVAAIGGNIFMFIGAKPTDGQTLKMATRGGSIPALGAHAAMVRRAPALAGAVRQSSPAAWKPLRQARAARPESQVRRER